MSKPKKKRSRANTAKPQDSFKNLVASAVTSEMKQFVQQQVGIQMQDFGRVVMQNSSSQFLAAMARIKAISECLEELGISESVYDTKVNRIEDEFDGLVPADKVTAGDRVRVELTSGDADPIKLKVDHVGDGRKLGKDLEDALIGANLEEEVKVTLGEGDDKRDVLLRVHTISTPKKEEEAGE